MKYDPELIRVLEEWGLSDKEAKIYLASLREEVTSPFAIARETGIPRTTVYTALTDLALKGLVELEASTGLQKQQTKVRAKNPSELRHILWEKRRELTRKDINIVSILPILKKEYVKDRVDANFHFYPGIEGAKEVLWGNEIDEEVLTFDYQTPMDAFGEEWMNKWVDRGVEIRRKARTKEYNLIPLTEWTKHVMSYQLSRNPGYLNNVEYRALDMPGFDQSTRMMIQGEWVKVVCIEGKEVWGLTVRSAEWAKSMKAIFWAVWSLAKPLTKEVIEGWGENEMFTEEQKLV